MENATQKDGYKKTEVGVIPSEWTVSRVDEIASISTGNKDTQDKIEGGTYPFFVRSQTPERINTYSYDGEAVLTAGDGVGVGKVFHYVTGRFDFHQRVYKISDFRHCDGKFFFLYFSAHFLREAQKYNAKTSVDSVRREMIAGMKIPLPPLAEQAKIAEMLLTWESAIETVKKLVARNRRRKRFLMQRLLTGMQRLPQFVGQPWRQLSLGELFERVTRKNNGQSTNVVTISAQRGFVRQDDFFKRQVASETLDNYFLVKKGEFCYNKSYSTGYDWGATKRLKDFDEAVVTTLYICFALRDPKKNSGDFFEHFFEAGSLDRGLTQIAHEGGRAHGLLNVTPSDFFKLNITVPDYDEQVAIARILDASDRVLQLLEAQLQALIRQKRGLMQQLLTGKIRVKVNED